jgi:hypothetical protein
VNVKIAVVPAKKDPDTVILGSSGTPKVGSSTDIY